MAGGQGEGEVTRLLAELRAGDGKAPGELVELVYAELRRLAASCMRRERPNHTLQATALVHEAYFRLVGQREVEWQSRAHFFGIAAQTMRRILLDHARDRRAAKRGGGARQVTLDDALMVTDDHLDNVLVLDESLRKLALKDAAQSRLVELRFFAGMTVEESAEVLGISTATVKREWSHARAWLLRDMNAKAAHAAG
jgi:RNA polymerase sigma-70 factor, ECF subfamily